MATASKALAYPHISVTPGVRGGRPCIAETRIAVMDIVGLERKGVSPEQMRTWFSSRPLKLAEVHAALTYYYDHKDEVDACFAKDQKWDAGHEERRDEYVKQKARG